MACINPDSLEQKIIAANKIVCAEPNYLELTTKKPIVFIGDTHGDYDSTNEVISRFQKDNVLVFLGDYVDRAPKEFGSIKNLDLILSAKIEKPDEVFLLRGNHEFYSVFSDYGFLVEISKFNDLHNTDLFDKTLSLFSNLPYAASTECGIIALHGGLADIESVDEIKQIPKGLKQYEKNNVASQIVWNDGFEDSEFFSKNNTRESSRGGSTWLLFEYGESFFKRKMDILNKKILLRGHNYRSKGHMFNNRMLTIFTCSRYDDKGRIKGSYIARFDPSKNSKCTTDLEIIKI